MRKQLPLLVLLLLPLLAWAQAVTVPKNVYFADVHLRISDAAQQEIQKKVDALHRNQTYFKIKVDLANAYFPVIERVFKEEGVPDDFKYLALQESGLIGDAVSTSNAVGYWQFKKEAASDFNLRMDNVVDERRHIIEASRGAALYFKRSNKNYDNWFTSLLSYYLGYTGVKTYSKSSDVGAKKMDVTEKSHPYVITFLAHKIAYDNFIGRDKPVVALRELRATPGQSLTDIALATKTDYAELEKYNKWLLGNSIPSDKDYYVMIPVRNGDTGVMASAAKEETPVSKPATVSKATPSAPQQTNAAATVVKRNGLNALIARPNDTKDKLALQAGISTRKFLKYNDLHNFDEIVAGSAYYIEQKKAVADAEYHIVQPGETMQLISQHYGIRLNYLRYKNRMARNEVPVPGRVLWLQKRRPSTTPVEVKDVKAKQNVASTAAPSYNRLEGTAVKEAPAQVKDEAPKDNVFKRFFNSFKKDKKETITAPEQKAAVAQTSPAAKPAKEAELTAPEKESTPEPAATENTEAVEAAPQPTGALYPSSKDRLVIKPKTENPAAVKTDAKAEPKQETKAPVTAEPKQEAKPEIKSAEKPVVAKQEEAEKIEAEEVESVLYQAPEKEEATTTAQTPEKQTSVPGSPTTVVNPTQKAVPTTKAEPASATEAAEEDDDFSDMVTYSRDPFEEDPDLRNKLAARAKAPKHVVAKGESLYAISKKYNVTVGELTSWNSLSTTALQPGMELIVAAPLVAASTSQKPAPQEAVTGATETHTVVAGETLYQLSKRYNVSVDELRTWNNLTDSNLKLGQELRVAAPEEEVESAPAAKPVPQEKASAPATGESIYHTVVAGESMYQISRKYGVTIKDVMEWNKKSDFNVKPGEKLLIKQK